MTVRLSVNINDETALDLMWFTIANDTTLTEEVRRAVGVYHFLWSAQQDGQRIELVEKRRFRRDLVTVVELL